MDRSDERRQQDWRKSPLLLAFIYSCLIHLLIFALWRMGVLELPDQLVQLFIKRRPPVAQKRPSEPPKPAQPAPVKEIPLTFIEVEPDPSITQAPKDAKFYSTANTVAANPNPQKETSVPKVDGKQEALAKLRDVPRAVLPPVQKPPPPEPPKIAQKSEPSPPVPTPPKEPPAATPPPTPQPQPQPLQPAVGNTDFTKPKEIAKTEPTPKPADAIPLPPEPPQPAPTPRPRPRTLAQAREQAGLAGEKMKQDAGVRRPGRLAVDAKATPFGEYDAAFIKMVQERWYYLLDNSSVSQRSGRVTVEFLLKYDGSIADMQIKQSEVGEALALICSRAITDPAPYPKWPADMHRMVGSQVRLVTFTFLYY